MEKVEIKTNPERLKPLVVGNKVFRSVYDCELSLEDVETARLELNETEDVRNNSLRTLREMLSRNETRYRTDDAYLLRFLRCRKFNCEEAYKMMHYMYSLKKDYPEVFCSLHPNFRNLVESRLFSCLPYRDEAGSIIIVDKAGRWDPKEESIYNLFQYAHPLAEIVLLNPSCQINKIVGIMDLKNLNLSHVAALLNPSLLPFWTKVSQNMFAWRIKHLILVNCNKYIYTVLKAVRHLLKQKIADRMVIIGSDISEMHQYLNPAILPKEYGGTLEESECSITDHIMDNLRYIEYELSFP